MKYFVDYLTGTCQIEKERDFYQSEHLVNKISVYLSNVSTSYFLTMEFLLPNGRKATIRTQDAFEDGEPTTLTKDGVEYSIHHFSLSNAVMYAAGVLAFTCYINFTNPSEGSVTERGVLFNGQNKIVKTVDYTNSTVVVLGDDEDPEEIINDITSEIVRLESLISSLSPYNRNTLKNIVREIIEELYPNISEEAL